MMRRAEAVMGCMALGIAAPAWADGGPVELWRDHAVMVVALLGVVFAAMSLTWLSWRQKKQLHQMRAAHAAQLRNMEAERARLRTLLHALPDLVWMKDPDGTYVFCNPGFEPLCGVPESEVVGRKDEAFVPAELANMFRQDDLQAMQMAEPHVFEEWLTFKDGSYTGLYRTSKTAVRDAQGHLLGVLGVARDITQERQAHNELQERIAEGACMNAVLRLTEEDSRPIVMVLNDVAQALAGAWHTASDARLCISCQDEVYGQSQHVAASTPASASYAFGEEGDRGAILVQLTGDKGECAASLAPAKRELLVHVAERLSSMLAHRRAQAQATRREQIFSAIVSQAVDGISLVDLETLAFVEFNDAACQLLGYAREELAHLRLPDVQAEFSEAEIRQQLAEHQYKMSGTFDTIRRRKDGSAFHVQVRMKWLTLDGKPYLSQIWSDTTERMAVQRLLMQEREQLKNILNATHAGTWEWSLDHQEARINARMAEIIGRPLREAGPVFYQDFLAQVHPDDQPALLAGVKAHLRGLSPYYAHEFRLRHRDGHWVWVNARGKVVQQVEGQRERVFSGIALDVSDRREAEALIRESEARFRRLFSDSRQPQLLLEEDRVADFNQAALDLIGAHTSEQLRGLTVADISLPMQPCGTPSAELARERIAQAMSAGSSRFEWTLRGQQGSTIVVEVMATTIQFGDRRVLHVVCTDITARQQLEEQLQQFELIVRSSEDAIISKTLDGRIASWNPGAQRMFGYRTEEAIGQPLALLIPPERVHEEEAIMARIVLGEKVEHFETERVCKDGRRIFVSATISPIHDAHGKVIGASKIARDITERRRSEEQLLKLSLAVEQSSNVIVITDLTGRIEYVNERFTPTTGYERTDVLGKSVSQLKSGHTPVATYEALWATITQGKVWSGEFINRRKDGSLYTEAASISPLRNQQGDITHYVAVKEDVTQRKRDEEELALHRQHLEQLVQSRTLELERAMLAAETANQAKSTFLANMSHEIRTPLNAILGFAHLLRPALHESTQQEKVDKILRSGQHLLGVINDILDISKIEAERMVLEQQVFLVPATIDHVFSMMAERMAGKNLSLRTDIDPQLYDLPVVGDPLRLGQILLNYLSNAFKFTREGSVMLRARVRSCTDAAVVLHFEVEDTGIGISAEDMARLFQAFEQAQASTTRQYGGTGLGLAISRQLAHLMGGEVGADSEPGRGSRFWFTVTLKPGQHSKLLRKGRIQRGGRPRPARVLLVEDNAINQDVATEMLTDLGMSVDVASNGQEAVDKATEVAYDLILMDMQMPVMDGLTATRQIRARTDLNQVPIVAMTANASSEDRVQCEEAGMNDFVPKPVAPHRLQEVLCQWLGVAEQPRQADVPQSSDEGIDVPGAIDTAVGLAHTGQRRARYLNLLRSFLHHHLDAVVQLQHAWDEGRTQDMVRLAHSLKSVAAALGMHTLSDAAAALEAGMKTQPCPGEVSAWTVALAHALSRVEVHVRQILARYETPASAAVPAVPSADVAAGWQALREALGRNDMQAYVLWRQWGVQFKFILAPDAWSQLQRDVEAFDFSAAQALLEQLPSLSSAPEAP